MANIYSSLVEPSRNETVSLGATSATIANARQMADQPRKVIIIRNISDDPTKIVSLTFGNEPAVANKGIVLRQYESVQDSADGQYLPWQGSIQAIGAVAACSLAIFER